MSKNLSCGDQFKLKPHPLIPLDDDQAAPVMSWVPLVNALWSEAILLALGWTIFWWLA
ncbi:MAG: hypothetical protein AB7U97_26430 [Pirellulales bacterium]